MPQVLPSLEKGGLISGEKKRLAREAKEAAMDNNSTEKL